MNSRKGEKNSSYKHGETSDDMVTAEYVAWCTMRRRCYEVGFMSYPNYGGRGITVCDSWMDKECGFMNFLNDVGRKPSPEFSLDRVNVDGNYEPNNVRWASRMDQNRNKRNTIHITYKGITKSLPEWAEERGMKLMTLWCRIFRSKMSVPVALETPIGRREFPNHHARKTNCPKGHPYSGHNLVIEKNGDRKCRTCRNERMRKRWHAKHDKTL